MTFSWFGRQMESATVNGTAITYKYNADGLRTEKAVGSTVSKYEYTGDKLFYEKRGNLEFHYRYDVFGNLASITRVNADGTSFSLYTVCNSRGDVEEFRRSTGELFARYVYDSWGNILHIYDANGTEITSTANLAVQNPFRYRGYYYDNETGLYYVGSRYYDPVTHRFVNADTSDVLSVTPMGLTDKNLFAYCDNNPVTRLDNSGKIWIHIAVGAVVGGIIGGVSTALGGGDCIDTIIGIVAGAGSGALAASGIGVIGQIIGSSSIAMASNALQQSNSLIKNEQNSFNVESMLFDGLVAGIFAAWSGNGASHGNVAGIKSSDVNFKKQIVNGKDLDKAFSYYVKTAHNSNKDFVLNSLAKAQAKSTGGAAVITFKEWLMEKRYG